MTEPDDHPKLVPIRGTPVAVEINNTVTGVRELGENAEGEMEWELTVRIPLSLLAYRPSLPPPGRASIYKDNVP